MANQARLKVIIVGAGIAGLTAGLMLREFSDITILETAYELKEVGAAVTLGPGAVGILRRFGVHLDKEGGVVATHTAVWTFKGKQVAFAPFNAIEKAGEVNVSVHRADLHSALLRSATSADGPGTPCKILLNHAVVKVDSDAGTVTVGNGTEFTADVIIGADGVRSNVRPFVVDGDTTAQPTGESGYRYLLRPEDLKAINHPLMKEDTIPPTINVVIGPQKKLVLYPCRGGQVFNCLAFVPDTELHETSSEKWQRKGDVNALLESYKDFDPMWTDILKLAKDVGLWQMRDLEPLPNWVKGRTIVIGDAAHPMLPHQAAGAMSAIEDAEALSAYLRKATSDPASIHEALDHVFRVRHKRASSCQSRSRAAGLVASDNIGKQSPDELFALWIYPGAEKYEAEHPEMVIPK